MPLTVHRCWTRRRFLALAVGVGVALPACSRHEDARTPSPAVSQPPPAPQASLVTATPTSTAATLPQTTPAPTGTVTWLRDQAISLATSDPDADFVDLQPLKAIIGDARIVALGEQTHGTHEFATMKHRLVRFLVREMGFTTFAIEANQPEAERIDQYLQTGAGNPAHLLAALSLWPWNTQEVLAMLQWMRDENMNAPGGAPLHFRGFDGQFIGGAIAAVLTYLGQVDPDHLPLVRMQYTLADARSTAGDPILLFNTESVEAQTAYHRAVQAVYDDLSAAHEAYTMRSSPAAFAAALQAARIVIQAVEIAIGAGKNDYTLRDRFMADNVGWLLDQVGPDAKIILWAHNGHVGSGIYGNHAPPVPPIPSMGMYLRDRYGDDLRVVGFATSNGSFNALSQYDPTLLIGGAMTTHMLPPPLPDSYEAAFAQTGLAHALVDLHAATVSGAGQWLVGPHPFRLIGALYADAYPEDFWYATRLTENFDALCYLRDTTPSILLPFP